MDVSRSGVEGHNRSLSGLQIPRLVRGANQGVSSSRMAKLPGPRSLPMERTRSWIEAAHPPVSVACRGGSSAIIGQLRACGCRLFVVVTGYIAFSASPPPLVILWMPWETGEDSGGGSFPRATASTVPGGGPIPPPLPRSRSISASVGGFSPTSPSSKLPSPPPSPSPVTPWHSLGTASSSTPAARPIPMTRSAPGTDDECLIRYGLETLVSSSCLLSVSCACYVVRVAFDEMAVFGI